MIYQHEKIGIFVDGSNLYAAAKSLSITIDYKKFKEYFAKQGRLIRSFYYTALPSDTSQETPIRPLVDFLAYNGWQVVTKLMKEFTNDFGTKKIKGNMDIEIACDILAANYLEHIVLVSGDGDFRKVVELAQYRGQRVTVVSTLSKPTPMIADELRRQADNFIDLVDIKPQVARFDQPRAFSET